MITQIQKLFFVILVVGFVASTATAQSTPTKKQLAQWLKRFPDADANQDGELSAEEAKAYRKKLSNRNKRGGARRGGAKRGGAKRGGAKRDFKVDPGWEKDQFPEHAVSLKSPEEIKAIYESVAEQGSPAVISFDPPADGAMRVVGTGHSFMAPGYKCFPKICRAAGFKQPLYTHTGGGMTGSARYKWEQENGIFGFDRNPYPKLLASISNAKWDAMMWGPYFKDRPEYYACWIDFCQKYNPDMKFYLSDAWPQLLQLKEVPKSEDFFTDEVLDRMGNEKQSQYVELVSKLRKDYPGKVFVLPTSDAMTLAAKHFIRGELPGVQGIHQVVGGKQRSLWRDQLGHLGPGFDRLEGYVFYATLYRRSPELIKTEIQFGDGKFPSAELDAVFRKIAWQAVISHPLSGVTDSDGDGIGDDNSSK